MNIISLFRIKLIEVIYNKGSSDPDQASGAEAARDPGLLY